MQTTAYCDEHNLEFLTDNRCRECLKRATKTERGASSELDAAPGSAASVNAHLDDDKAAIQCDEIGWKVVAPDGRVIRKLEILQACAALMSWNGGKAYWYRENWWPTSQPPNGGDQATAPGAERGKNQKGK